MSIIFFATILINRYESKSLSEDCSSTQIYQNDRMYHNSKTYFLKHHSKLMLLNFKISLVEVVRHIRADR